MLLRAQDSTVLVVDVQEKLVPAIHEHGSVVDGIEWLVGVAGVLEVPARVSEQYPKGLGHTVPQLAEYFAAGTTAEKTTFACSEDDACSRLISETGRRQVVICGIEAHVCVLQTALGLHQQGYEVFVVADAVGSRNPMDRDLALARFRSHGLGVVSREMVAFEWLHRAGTEVFREVSRRYLR